ncbi:MAG TPA: FecR family protein [Thermoanaerobaculia bacterium]|jgi:ferric-dicitrate binding protein FerR (iron transport regulator)|nr:FecR family protein [Thermoanaerobaculia bacterium]
MNEQRARDVETVAAGEAQVAALLRLAGAAPALSEEELLPARAAARAVWQRQVRQRARRRQAWAAGALAASLVAAVSVAWWVRKPAVPAAPVTVASLELRSGDVTVEPAPAISAAAGTTPPLLAGTVLTSAADGRAALRLAGGVSVRLDGGSRVRLLAPRALALESGALYVDSGALPGAPLEVVTPLGRVTDLGTQFEVRLAPAGAAAPALHLRVREGEVRVDSGGATHRAEAGSELLLAADGTVRHGALAADDPAWQWAARAAPAIEIEGRTLASFLDRETRELGLRWRLVEPRPEQAPNDVVLHGSVDGLTPEEAIEVVLTGSGLRGARAHGELLLSAAPR